MTDKLTVQQFSFCWSGNAQRIIWCVHVCLSLLILWVPAPSWVRFGGVIVVLLSLVWHTAAIKKTRQIAGIRIEGARFGFWQKPVAERGIVENHADEEHCIVLYEVFLTRLLMVLVYRYESDWAYWRRSMIILCADMQANDYRRLYINLNHLTPAAFGVGES